MYNKTLADGYILGIGTGDYAAPISENEYNEILALIRNRPTAPEGFVYKLRADTLEWDLVELPPEPEPELSDEEVLEILLGGGEA